MVASSPPTVAGTQVRLRDINHAGGIFCPPPAEAAMSGMGLPLVDQLKTRMQWLQTRQKLLAENVANADTPRFRPKDLQAMPTPGVPGGVRIEATAPGHITSSGGPGSPGQRGGEKFETR